MMMKMMKQSIKRMVLTGAAVTAIVSFAAPAAMAQEVVVRDHRDGSAEEGPIVRDHRDGSGGILCSIFPASCEPPPYDVSDPVVPPPVVNDPPDPVVEPAKAEDVSMSVCPSDSGRSLSVIESRSRSLATCLKASRTV